MIYRIKDWEKHFEINRSKDLKQMTWVPIPNKQDGDGYTELVTEHENGPSHYAVWVACVLIASKCDPRGTMLRDGRTGHTPQTIARKSRLPALLIEEALPRFLDIGWMELIEISQHDAEIPHHDAQKGREGKGEQDIEGKGLPAPPDGSVSKKAFSRLSVAEKRSALWQECLRQSGGSVEGAEEFLKQYSAFKDHEGIRNVRSLKGNWLNVTYDKAFAKSKHENDIKDAIKAVKDAE